MTPFSFDAFKSGVMEGEIAGMTDRALLTALLTYGKQKEPQETSDRLLHTYRSLSNILRLSTRDLMSEGLSTHSALLVGLVLPLWGRALFDSFSLKEPLDTSSRTGAFLLHRFCGERLETVYLLLLREDYTLLDCQRVTTGSINTTTLNTRALAEAAVFSGASYAVLAHNHPGGTTIPSRNDILATQRIQETLDTVGVPLLEHYIVAEGEYLPLLEAQGTPHPKAPQGYYDKEYPCISLETL